jgi:hypothetical protein
MPKHCETGEGQCGRGRNGQMHLPGPTGYGRRHGGKDVQSKLGNLSVTTWRRLTGKDPFDEYISGRKLPRDSDVAIVSADLAGQNKPLASQGPLDWRRPGNGPRHLVRKDHRGTSGGRVMAYKLAVVRCRCVSYANGRGTRWRRSPWLISSLKPYWGKPAVRNFRGGGGNVCTVWRLFATKLERADTSEADSTYTWRASSLLDRNPTSRSGRIAALYY